jgi:hypothetical protein
MSWFDLGMALMLPVTSSALDAQTVSAFHFPRQTIADALPARLYFPILMMPCPPS